jgi:phenylpropionate dioxygenase-like ring-hydroxylating dioxygenase large terminal subunit
MALDDLDNPVRRRVREDFVPAEHYTDPEITRLEGERLWPKIWQWVGREEDLPDVGSYLTYDNNKDAVVIVRSAPGKLRAFHNVCPHRANRLAMDNGRITKFYCRFHGWQWNLDGEVLYIKDREDFAGCPEMDDADLAMSEVLVDTWGGFIFINMDRAAEPLATFLAPTPEFMDCLDLAGMRRAWDYTVDIECNWKIAIQAFLESYHVAATHHQLLAHVDEISVSWARGKHGHHGYPNARPMGLPSPRIDRPMPADNRANVIEMYEELFPTSWGASADHRDMRAIRRLMDVLPPEASAIEALMKASELIEEEAKAEGVVWPQIPMDKLMAMGVDWNVFPNMVMVYSPFQCLIFRARPAEGNPDRTRFDLACMFRYPSGKEPKVVHEYLGDWRQHVAKLPAVLVQDFQNLEQIQKSVTSRGFRGSRINPVQEIQISNMHRVLEQYLFGLPDKPFARAEG